MTRENGRIFFVHSKASQLYGFYVTIIESQQRKESLAIQKYIVSGVFGDAECNVPVLQHKTRNAKLLIGFDKVTQVGFFTANILK